VLLGQSEHGRDVLVEADVRQRTAIRVGKWKLLDMNLPGAQAGPAGKNCELYDLETDPGETTDVAGQHADVVADMWDKLEKIRKRA
jgi:arylsulfatase